MPNVYWQKLLRVDLSRGTHAVETLDEVDLKRFIGGAVLGAEITHPDFPSSTRATASFSPQDLSRGLRCPAGQVQFRWHLPHHRELYRHSK